MIFIFIVHIICKENVERMEVPKVSDDKKLFYFEGYLFFYVFTLGLIPSGSVMFIS